MRRGPSGELGFVFVREPEEGVAAVQVELGGDVGAVSLDGPWTDEKFSGDLFAGLRFCNQVENPPLGRRQQLDPRFFASQR